MLAEHYDDLHDVAGHAGFTAWRCVNCGAVLDPVIAGNRLDSTRTPHSHESVIPS